MSERLQRTEVPERRSDSDRVHKPGAGDCQKDERNDLVEDVSETGPVGHVYDRLRMGGHGYASMDHAGRPPPVTFP